MIQDTLPVDLNILKLTASGKAHYCWVHFCRHRLKVDGSSGPGSCPKSVIVISTVGRNPFFVQISQSRSSPRSRRGSFEMTNMAYKTASPQIFQRVYSAVRFNGWLRSGQLESILLPLFVLTYEGCLKQSLKNRIDEGGRNRLETLLTRALP